MDGLAKLGPGQCFDCAWAINRIETYLCSTLFEQTVTDLAVLSIEREVSLWLLQGRS